MTIEKLEQAKALEKRINILASDLEGLELIKSNYNKGTDICIESGDIAVYIEDDFKKLMIDLLQALKLDIEKQLTALEKELEKI